MTTKVRASKFRHVFGKPLQATECYRDVTYGNISTESTVIKANELFWAVPWKTPATICVVPHSRVGAVLEDGPLIVNVNDDGEKPVLSDFNFSPHDNFLIALAGVDGSAALYRVPSTDGLSESITQAERRIRTGDARLLGIDWHPLASGLLYTTSAKKEVVFWDAEAGSEISRLPEAHKGLLVNNSWNKEGSLLATSAKDKFVRIFDPRNQSLVGQVEAHASVKGARVQWMNSSDLIVTAGFTKTNEREMAVFDPRNFGTRLQTVKLPTSTSNSLLFEDVDTGLLLVAGKGDGNISFFEFEDGVVHYLTEYKSNAPQNGLALLPKKSCNLSACEVIRVVKLSGTKVEPIRIEVPRSESSFFQEDLYPDTWDLQPTTTAGEWASGANVPRNVVSLNPGN